MLVSECKLIMTIGSEIVYSKVGAYISDKYGAYYVIILGSISQALGQLLVIINNETQSTWVFIIAYIFFGGADSCFQTQALALTLYYFPGLSSTANSCFRLVFFFLAHSLSHYLIHYLTHYLTISLDKNSLFHSHIVPICFGSCVHTYHSIVCFSRRCELLHVHAGELHHVWLVDFGFHLSYCLYLQIQILHRNRRCNDNY